MTKKLDTLISGVNAIEKTISLSKGKQFSKCADVFSNAEEFERYIAEIKVCNSMTKLLENKLIKDIFEIDIDGTTETLSCKVCSIKFKDSKIPIY